MAVMAVMAGVAAVSAVAQYYSAEKGRKASKKQLNKIEALFNAIKPPDLDLSVTDPPELFTQLTTLPEFSDPATAPKFDLSKLEPEDLKMLGKMNPELPALVVEAEPTLIEKTKGMEEGREAQLSALRKMKQIGESDFDPEYQQRVQEAARSAQGEAQSRQASIMQDFARRGISGSGMNLASQMGATASSMDRAAQTNQAAATDAYKNRLNALMSGAQLGSQIGAEDKDLQSRNTGIINAFNQRVSKGRQNYEDSRANAMNNAQKFNLGMAQNIEGQNVGARNQAAQADQARIDALAKYGASFAQQEQGRADRNQQQQFQNQTAQNQYQNQLAAGQAAWRAGEQEKQNQLKQQQFSNETSIAQGKSGIAGQQAQSAMSAAKDRNSLLQGLSNTAMMGGMAYQQAGNQDRTAFNNANNATMASRGKFMDPDQEQAWKKSYGEY